MRQPRTAVILAAGRGRRLGRLGAERPKGFIELDGRPIIERSLAQLRACGVRRVLIVTGHHAGFYGDLAARLPGIELVHNPRYASSGSLYSLFLARERIGGEFLLLESDLIYEQRALQALESAPSADALLVSGPTHSGDEVYVEADQLRLTGLSKRRSALKGTVVGELVGITRLSSTCLAAMCAYAQAAFRDSPHVEYEEALVAAARTVPVLCRLEPNLAWAEIDDETHLARARGQVLPLIAARDAAVPDGA